MAVVMTSVVKQVLMAVVTTADYVAGDHGGVETAGGEAGNDGGTVTGGGEAVDHGGCKFKIYFMPVSNERWSQQTVKGIIFLNITIEY